MDGQQGENAGIKLAQRLMVDIMGALIPGTMFWFSVLVGGVFPFLFLINIHINYQNVLIGRVEDGFGLLFFWLF